MTAFRFIHCSDLHIDSPFKGLIRTAPSIESALRAATEKAWLNIVGLAIRERVDAVLVAGDIFDSADRSLRAQFKFREGLRLLDAAGIPAFIACGNHDPLESWARTLEFPDNVKLFQADTVQGYPVIRDGRAVAQVYGISFPGRDVHENLALRFGREARDGFAVGLLHANVGGNREHDNYAPCSVSDLRDVGLDYWALGHIHKREVVSVAHPAIVYCGNSQARHFKEAEPKGCCLVTLREEAEPDIRFIPADAVRFLDVDIEITGAPGPDDLADAVIAGLESHSQDAADRPIVARAALTGRASLGLDMHEEALSALADEIASRLPTSKISLELVNRARGLHNLEALRAEGNFLTDVVTLYDEAMAQPDKELTDALAEVFSKWKGRALLDPLSPEEMRDLLEQARDLTLDHLMVDGEEG